MTTQPASPQGDSPARRAQIDPALQGRLRSLQDVLRAWLVRVVLVMAVMFALDHYMGPVRWFWPLIGFYAFVSLVAGVGAARFMNRNLIEAHRSAAADARDTSDQDQRGNDPEQATDPPISR